MSPPPPARPDPDGSSSTSPRAPAAPDGQDALPVLGEFDGLLADEATLDERLDQALALVRQSVRTYLDAVGVIVVALDSRGRVLFINRRGCELLGCDGTHDVLGADWIESFIPERLRADTRDVLSALWAGHDERAATSENEVVTRSGAERTIAWTNEVLRDDAGVPWAVVGSGIDVTERRRTEHRLARVGRAVEAARDGIGIIDLIGRAVYMNPALCGLTGYTPGELADAGGPLALFAQAGVGRSAFIWAVREDSWTGEVEMRTRSGQPRHVLLRVSVIRDERSRVIGLLGIHTDITEKKRVGEALRRSEARNRALVEALPDLIVLFSDDGTVQDIEAPAGGAFPFQTPAVGRPLHEVFPPEIATRLARAAAGDVTPDAPRTLHVSDGEQEHAFESRVIHVDNDGFLGILRDVTERHRLEAEVLRATDEERQRLGRDLHDGLGSHLVGLRMLVRGLARTARNRVPDLADELDDVAQLIGEGADQARALAHGLNPVGIDRQSLPGALERLAASTDNHADLRCTFRALGQIPPVRSDVATQLYRIAQEAVTNALRHAEASHITIELGEDDGAVVLAVDDDGRGFADAASPDEQGLGLHTMAYRAGTIGGTLNVQEKPEGGVAVTCRLTRPPSGDSPSNNSPSSRG